MNKALQELIEEERKEGLQEGLQKGIKFLVAAYRKLGMSNEQIIEQIAAEYEISQSEVAKYVYAV